MDKSYESHSAVGVERRFRSLENRIMEDVARRLKKTGNITSSADYQLNRYYILGNSSKDIEDIIKSTVGEDFPETFALYDDVINKQYTRSKELYEQVNETFIPYEQNQELQQITGALIRQSNDELYNITRSLGFKIDMGGGRSVFTPLADYYNDYLDNAMVEITSGTFDYNTVIRRVVSQMTNSGLRMVEYASGHTKRCDVAARSAIMTGLTQLTGKISDFNAQKLHTDYFEVAWHEGARPTHRVWQGKVWNHEELIAVCGLGSVTGLDGANCYHEYYPFIPGASERQWSDKWLEEQNKKEDIPKLFKGKEYTRYEATQRQRYLEINMRAQRQKVKLLQEAGADSEEVMLARCKYQAQLDEYKAFSKKMGLPEQRERIYYDLQGRIAPSGKNIGRKAGKPTEISLDRENKKKYELRAGEWKEKTKISDGMVDIPGAHEQFVKRLRDDDNPSRHKAALTLYSEMTDMVEDAGLSAAFAYISDDDIIKYNSRAPHIGDYNLDYVFAHETSHRMDEIEYHSWENQKFLQAIEICQQKVYDNREEVQKWFEPGGRYESSFALSDIVDALSEGSIFVPIGHGEDYWKGAIVYEPMEIFANLSSIDVLDLDEKEELLSTLFDAYREITT